MLNLKILYRFIPSHYHQPLIQFIKFGIVGSTGLIIDISTVYLLRSITGFFIAATIAYFIAASSNWFLNRLWTFYNHQHTFLSQWIRYLLTNTLGFLCNRGVVFLLAFLNPTYRNYPYIPLIIGAITGMTANFHLARKLVYTKYSP